MMDALFVNVECKWWPLDDRAVQYCTPEYFSCPNIRCAVQSLLYLVAAVCMFFASVKKYDVMLGVGVVMSRAPRVHAVGCAGALLVVLVGDRFVVGCGEAQKWVISGLPCLRPSVRDAVLCIPLNSV